MTTTAQIIAGFYNLAGITTESDLDSVVVGTGASQVALNNPNRVSLLFINISADIIFIGFSPDPSSTNGILLVPNGGSFGLDITTDFQLTGYAVYAISTGAASNLLVLETALNN